MSAPCPDLERFSRRPRMTVRLRSWWRASARAASAGTERGSSIDRETLPAASVSAT